MSLIFFNFLNTENLQGLIFGKKYFFQGGTKKLISFCSRQICLLQMKSCFVLFCFYHVPSLNHTRFELNIIFLFCRKLILVSHLLECSYMPVGLLGGARIGRTYLSKKITDICLCISCLHESVQVVGVWTHIQTRMLVPL